MMSHSQKTGLELIKENNDKPIRYKITKPMQIHHQLWYRVTECKGSLVISSLWMVYDIDKKSHSFVTQIPWFLVQNSKFALLDQIALNENIYFFDGDGDIVLFNTKNATLSIINLQKDKIAKGDAKLIYTVNNSVYSRSYSFNTKTNQIHRISRKNKSIHNILQDPKTGRWYGHKTKKNKDNVYCYSGNMKYDRRYNDIHTFCRDGGKQKIKEDLIDFELTEYSLAYDDYLIYLQSSQQIFIWDFINGDFCDINLSEFGINSSGNCNGIIIDQYKDVLKMILLWLMVENGVYVYIPNVQVNN